MSATTADPLLQHSEEEFDQAEESGGTYPGDENYRDQYSGHGDSRDEYSGHGDARDEYSGNADSKPYQG